jgi:DNA-binding NarL/FixJ family response regulator
VIRVLLVDHPPAMRRALQESVGAEPDLRVVGATGSLAEARRLARGLGPDVIVLDSEMAGLDLPRAVRALGRASPASALVVATMDPDRLGRDLADAGRVVAVSKIDGRTALLATVRRAARRDADRP